MAENPFAADPLFVGVPDDRLAASTEGCRELTCLYHGRINREIHRRAKEKADG